MAQCPVTSVRKKHLIRFSTIQLQIETERNWIEPHQKFTFLWDLIILDPFLLQLTTWYSFGLLFPPVYWVFSHSSIPANFVFYFTFGLSRFTKSVPPCDSNRWNFVQNIFIKIKKKSPMNFSRLRNYEILFGHVGFVLQ